jgi:hypothetical protein
MHRGIVEFARSHRFPVVSRADGSLDRPVRLLNAAQSPMPRGRSSVGRRDDRAIEQCQSRLSPVFSVTGGTDR